MHIQVSNHEHSLIVAALVRDSERYADPETRQIAKQLALRLSDLDSADDGPEIVILSIEAHYARVHGLTIQEAARRLHRTTTRE